MAKYIIGAGLTGTPAGYDGYFTSVSAAVTGMSNGDTADVMDGTYASANVSKALTFSALANSAVMADNATTNPLRVSQNVAATFNGMIIQGRADLGTTLYVWVDSTSGNTKTFSRCTIGPIVSGSGLRVAATTTTTVVFSNGIVIATGNFPCFYVTAGGLNVSSSIITAVGSSTKISDINAPGVAVTFDGNVFNLTSQALAPIKIANASSATTFTATSNKIYSDGKTSYFIGIGDENTGANNGNGNGAIIRDNSIYGPLFYNPETSGVTVHALFVGHNINPDVRRNIVRGGGYGFVFKGTSQTDVSGKVRFNVFLNCSYGYRIKGIAGVKIHHSTLYSTLVTYTNNAVDISDNSGVGAGSVTEFKNNIVRNNGYLMWVDSGGTLSNCDYNCYISPNAPTTTTQFLSGGSGKTWSAWVGLGHDTNSFYIHDKGNGTYDVYKGSAPLVVDRTLSFCPVKFEGKLEDRSDNPLINAGVFISGVNDTGEVDAFGGYVYKSPNIGADQLAGTPYRSYGVISPVIESTIGA